jgi:hypothetical protein
VVDEPATIIVTSPPGTPYRSLGGGRWAPRTLAVTYHYRDRPAVRMEIVIASDGVPVVRRVIVTAEPVELPDEPVHWSDRPSTAWRAPIRDDLRLPLSTVAPGLEGMARAGEVAPPGTDARPGQRFTDAFANHEPTARAPRRRKLTPELLAGVAEVVRDARATGKPIRRAVAEHYGPMSELTARNWIAAARVEGYLDDEGDGEKNETD